MNIDISAWGKYGAVDELLERYNKEDISELLEMKVEVNNYNEEDYFNTLTKKVVSLDKIKDFEKIILCKYILYNFYQIFFERKTALNDDSKITVTRFRALEDYGFFEDIFDTYLELFKTGGASGNTISQDLYNIFKELQNTEKLPSKNQEIEYNTTCSECNGYGYIDLVKCPSCNGNRTVFFTDYDLSEYYKRIYRHEIKILSYDKEDIKKCFVDILKNMFGESAVPLNSYYKPKCKLIGEDGNVFNLLNIVIKTLKKERLLEEAESVNTEVLQADSYDEAIRIFMKYVDIY